MPAAQAGRPQAALAQWCVCFSWQFPATRLEAPTEQRGAKQVKKKEPRAYPASRLPEIPEAPENCFQAPFRCDGLECQTDRQFQLPVARREPWRRQYAETVSRAGVIVVVVRILELGCVGQVIDLCPQLHFEAFRKADLLAERHIPGMGSRSGESVLGKRPYEAGRVRERTRRALDPNKSGDA